MPNGFAVDYAELTQMLEDWPVQASPNYVGNIPNIVGMGETKLIVDLGLDIFDAVDSSFTLTVGNQLVTKPAGLIQLRSMRTALITGTTTLPASANSLILDGAATFENLTTMPMTGALGPGPAVLSPAAQVTVTQDAGGASGISIVITGLDQNGAACAETISTVVNALVSTVNRFSQVTNISSFNGGGTDQTVKVGNAAVAASTLGASRPVFRRSKDFCDSFNSDPSVVSQPRYFNELNTTQWQLVNAADQSYAVVVHFIERPPSIVTAGTTWLGTFCGELLFLASLMESERYIKADDRFADIASDYMGKLQSRRTELRESIRVGDYSPMKAAATKSQ